MKLSKIQTLKLAHTYIGFLAQLLNEEEHLETPNGLGNVVSMANSSKFDYGHFKEILSFSFGKKRMDKVVSSKAAETAAALAVDYSLQHQTF